MSQKAHWVMDYETLYDCFVAVFIHYKTEEKHIFVIGHFRNDFKPLLSFFKRNINNGEWHISFNGLQFDGQITEYIIRNHKKMLDLSGPKIANLIYQKAQDCIDRGNRGDFQEWSERYLTIKQIDVYKLNHWDSNAKHSSLKWIQFTTDWYNIQDMPIHHATRISKLEDLKTIVSYCINDTNSTKFIAMEKCPKLISLRGKLTKEFGVRLYSASEPRISKEIFLHYLSEKTGIEKKVLKRMRTRRGNIMIRDILLPYLRFQTKEFQKMLIRFQHLVVHGKKTRGAFEYKLKYRGVETKLGMGGVHGARKGVFKAGNGMIIMSSDVVSYYPNLVIRNGWAPKHLPKEEFCEQYEWFFNERRKIPKKDPRNYLYKIILNSTFGLSLEQNSFMYDPLLGMRITINGQLSLMMLYEMLAENVPGCIPLMQNTDGVEMMIPEQYKEKYLEICKQWEKTTKLELEHDQYEKLVIPDVNNYVGVFKLKQVSKEDYDEAYEDNPHNVYKQEGDKYFVSKTKTKGRFDFVDLALHKAKSFLVVRKAVFYYFVHGVEPEDYLETNRNIFDYCAGVRATGDWTFINTYMEKGELHEDHLQKTLRYYVSTNGTKIMKFNKTDGRKNNVESEGKQTVFNVYEEKEWEDYHIDEVFYLEKIRKEITGLVPEAFTGQLDAFKS